MINNLISQQTSKGGSTYTFKGDSFWKLTDDSIQEGYPKSIPAAWEGLPGNLDAAFTWTNGKTYFFKGSQYWRFSNMTRERGYPKMISQGFDGIPDNLDAAFLWSGNGKIYFFKGSKYWKFEPERSHMFDLTNTQSPFLCGIFQTTWMQPCNGTMAGHISSNQETTGDSMTGSSRWTWGILPFQDHLLSGGLAVQQATS